MTTGRETDMKGHSAQDDGPLGERALPGRDARAAAGEGRDASPRRPPSRLAALRGRASRTVAIFGAGVSGRLALQSLASEARVVAVVDNDAGTWGSTLAGVPVVSPASLAPDWPDTVVVASHAHDAITQQLIALGLGRHRIHVFQPSREALTTRALSDTVRMVAAQLNDLLEIAPPASRPQRLVVFGAGAGGREAYARLRTRHRLIAFADNDRTRAGQQMLGLPIIAPDQLAALEYEGIVVASIHVDAIRTQLLALGVPADRIRTVDDVL